MGKILTRTERSETEYPVVMMAAPVTDMALPSSAWLKANGGKYDMDPDLQRSFTRGDYQDVNNRARGVIPTTANTIDEYGNGDSTEHGENRKQEVDSLQLKSFSDDWWSHSISCADDYQPYDIDQAEEAPYWLNSEERSDSANTCFNNAHYTKNDISDQNTTDSHVQGLKDKNGILTKTEEKIQSLKALLAEQEKAINRLKSEKRERIFESKGFLTKEDHEYSLGKQVSCKNERDVSVKSHQKLIPMNDLYKEFKRTSTGTSRKRMRTEDTALSNTKRFRYNLRKDIPLDVNRSLERKTKETVSLFKDKITLESFKGDKEKKSFTQDEFLSFLGLVRTTMTVSDYHQEIL